MHELIRRPIPFMNPLYLQLQGWWNSQTMNYVFKFPLLYIFVTTLKRAPRVMCQP